MSELVFDVTQEGDGGFVAEALGEGVITEADTWEELREKVREAVAAYFFDRAPPQRLWLRPMHDDVKKADAKFGKIAKTKPEK
ncbi:MAG: hypothetical protein WDN03_15660 [Rhizomicrobium sp.]